MLQVDEWATRAISRAGGEVWPGPSRGGAGGRGGSDWGVAREGAGIR